MTVPPCDHSRAMVIHRLTGGEVPHQHHDTPLLGEISHFQLPPARAVTNLPSFIVISSYNIQRNQIKGGWGRGWGEERNGDTMTLGLTDNLLMNMNKFEL